jgi:hemolysin D
MQEQSVILEQPALWSRVSAWLIVGATTSGVLWAAFANLDQTVVATGKLEPLGAVKEIKAPMAGVVNRIFVKDGQLVKKDQTLLTFDSTVHKADLDSLKKLRATLEKENQFYQAVTNGENLLPTSSDLASLAKLRANLISENRYYLAVKNGLDPKVTDGAEFYVNQQQLVAASRAEIQSTLKGAQLQIQELEKQRSQSESQLITAKSILTLNQGIGNRISPLAKEGAIPQLQYERQQQEIFTRQAEVERLLKEKQKNTIAIDRAKQNLQNVIALSAKEFSGKIAANHQKIADIDTQLAKAKLENNKKIAEIDAQLRKTKQALHYQELQSPVNGIVFELQPRSSGFVVSETQTILKIVPNDNLIASAYLTNRDIGFVREGMSVDIRIDSFPSTEFGSIKGKLISIGSDALPPTQERPFYAFPVQIKLELQHLMVNGKPINLQSGMSVNCNILVRKRPVLSILTDLFDKQVKSLESIR